MDFSPDQIITGLVGLGLVLKGIMGSRNKQPRGCTYGDSAHDKLDTKLDTIIKILEDHVKTTTSADQFARDVLNILRDRKN